ncbi:uncharacterized protein LOC126903642 isoform X1 [Daktulosphaira vitifoliae]|uniref:uncharacterized protein LOC126903642 isoform X1 n=1 Tax=Daktulosphaira vitifoliae TaxID=58002 RepID=UPI0021AA1310|nr:uncharacterized protein LOC126903642 isoform X1 [Daktulosphaira vitifoliae]
MIVCFIEMLITSNNSRRIINVTMVLLLMQVNHNDTLNTGYKENQVKSIENVQLLKCSYLINALKYMQISKIELYHPDRELKNVFYSMSRYLGVLKKMMSTLFGFKGVEIGSLWLLNLYLGIVCRHVHKLIQSNSIQRYSVEYIKIYLKDTHDYIIDELDSEASGMECNTDKNQFYINENELKQLKNQPLKDIFNIIKKEISIINNFILKNTDLPAVNYEKFTVNNILIQNIGDNAFRTNLLMNSFNVQVDWNVTKKSVLQKLQEKYEKANNIDWRKNQLSSIQKYYDLVFSFFKVIILRLTWKHILYVKKQENESTKEVLIDKWVKILRDFVKFLHLKDNDYVNMVKKTIENQRDVDDHLLKSYLNTLCLDLGCNALEEMELNGKENYFVKDEICRPVHNEIELETVKFYSLGATERFISNLKRLFIKDDFDVIKSFIDYAENNKLFSQIEKKIEYSFSLLDI